MEMDSDFESDEPQGFEMTHKGRKALFLTHTQICIVTLYNEYREFVLFIGTRFSNLYTAAEAA
jgi:hypothetical protein